MPAAVLVLGLAVMIWLTSGLYGQAQTATTAAQFHNIVKESDRSGFATAAVADLLFAAAYAVLAVSLSLRVRGPAVLKMVARFGSALVVLAALLDEVENIRLLRNIADYGSLDDAAVRQVSMAGSIKWGLGIGGAVVVLLCLVAGWFSTSAEKRGAGVNLNQAATLLPDKAKALRPKWRRGWIIAIAAGIVALSAAVVFGRPSLWSAVSMGVAIQVLTWALRILWKAEVQRSNNRWSALSGRVRSILMIGIPVLAAGVSLFFAFLRDTYDVAVYVVVVGAYIAVGLLLRRWRKDPRRSARWGPGILLAALALGVVSLLVATVNVSAKPLLGVLVAVLVFPVGLSLMAEDDVATDGTAGRLRLAWGAAALGAGMAGLLFAGIGELQAIILTVLLVALVALIASDTSHDIVLVLVAIGLIWSLEPDAGSDEPDPEAGKPTIIAMGDSYISGEGAPVYYKGTNHNHGDDDRNECRRAPTAYPVRVQEILRERGEEYELLFLACSGAKITELTREAQYPDEPSSPWSDRGGLPAEEGLAQLPQAIEAIEALDLKPEVVLISIGGNDSGFGEIGETCGLPGDCSLLGQRFLDRLEEVTRPRLEDAYELIAGTNAFADARIIIMPYPVPLNESGCTASVLRSNEHRFLVGFTRTLNRMLQEEAEEAGFEFMERGVDVFTRERLRICDVSPSRAAVNQLAASPIAGVFLQQVSPRGWFHNTFHPNHRGHERMAEEVADWISADAPSDAELSTTPRSLSGIMGAGFDHCESGHRVPATCHDDRRAWTVAAVTRMLWAVFVPVLLLVCGALLVSLEVMRRWSRPEHPSDDEPAAA